MNIESVLDYFPGMDIIDSDIKERVKKSYEEVKNIKVTKADVVASLESSSITPRDFYNLLSDEAGEYLEVIADLAKEKRIRYFGNNVCLFSPIYIANYCENSCRYCGFRAKSDIKRAKLTFDEIEAEMKALADTGIEDVLILTGESKKFSSIEYIAEACKIASKYFKVIGIEVYPANVDDYKLLRQAGADFVTVFQETYNPETYDYYHPYGHKRSFSYRFDTQERALQAGFRGVGFGTLFGLGDPIEEAFKLAIHASEIQKKYPYAEIAISLPRIRPTHGADNSLKFNIVDDKKFFQIMAAIRMFLPFASITLSTRESKDFRNLAVNYAATKISASVDTSIGHRSKESQDEGDEQFVIDDARSTAETFEDLKNLGMTPVFTDYINL
ncbi:2-iminoacetate synthase ThiH [Anaerococcus murdochii]|uniref:2-iminoacetate synthase ThiH n=1 Tax=Anaerococcus murdochii TaxID=411577 RepID=A0ABS7SXF9_9FIRM|nr:2-iminoacetate synthase ThiH [Anaerococcus murdochii]MBZ2386197.1 2-iminoacetate synthase ThiH [Anaerococcus murdochii]